MSYSKGLTFVRYIRKITQNQYTLYRYLFLLLFKLKQNSTHLSFYFEISFILFYSFLFFFSTRVIHNLFIQMFETNFISDFFCLVVFVVSILIASLHKTKERYAENIYIYIYIYLNNLTFNKSSLSLNVNREFNDKL